MFGPLLDVNSELFNARAHERIVVALASTLSLKGELDDGTFNPAPGPSLADPYDYVMHGRVFGIKYLPATEGGGRGGELVEVQASFGGLLFRLRGEQAQCEALSMDMMFYLLMRKAAGGDASMDI